jgi:hypothetical protein
LDLECLPKDPGGKVLVISLWQCWEVMKPFIGGAYLGEVKSLRASP